MVIVDTSVWIDYLRGELNPETNWLNDQIGKQPLALTDLIVCEVLQGIRDEAAFRTVHRELLGFPMFENGGVDTAVAASQNFRKLRQNGYTVRKTIDSLIATFCLRNDHTLLHRDRDFDAFEKVLGMKVLKP